MKPKVVKVGDEKLIIYPAMVIPDVLVGEKPIKVGPPLGRWFARRGGRSSSR